MSSNPAKDRLHADLIASIEAEDRYFNMAYWVTDHAADPFCHDPNEPPATCDTASCLAGHIEAVRPELAAELAPRFRARWGLDHQRLAQTIYELETGEPCPLDFLGRNRLDDVELDQISREDAVLHVRGEHDEWPLLGGRAEGDGDDD